MQFEFACRDIETMNRGSLVRARTGAYGLILLVILGNVLFQCRGVDGVSLPREKIKGMAFTSGHDLWAYRQPFADESLLRLRETGTKYIHLTTILGMNTTTSSSSYMVTDDASAVYIIRKVHSLGFRILLKPIVQTRRFVWRGYIPPTRNFFRKIYTPFIVRMARIAEREGVAMFSVGSELQRTVRERQEWARVISRVRSVYKGPITYVANHDSYFYVSFWSLCDFISISGYFRLVEPRKGLKTPGLEETKRLWLEQASKVVTWRSRSNLTHLKVLIAEAGAMSKGNNIVYTRPWDYDAKGPLDHYAQVKIYEGLFNAFMCPQWSMGIMLYNWEARPIAGYSGPSLKGYTPQGKPAFKVMLKYFNRNC